MKVREQLDQLALQQQQIQLKKGDPGPGVVSPRPLQQLSVSRTGKRADVKADRKETSDAKLAEIKAEEKNNNNDNNEDGSSKSKTYYSTRAESKREMKDSDNLDVKGEKGNQGNEGNQGSPESTKSTKSIKSIKSPRGAFAGLVGAGIGSGRGRGREEHRDDDPNTLSARRR